MYTIPPKIFAVNYNLFWEYLRYAVIIFSSETSFSSCSCTCPILSWDSSQYAMAAFNNFGIIYFIWSCSSGGFSELISHKLLGGWSIAEKHTKLRKHAKACGFCTDAHATSLVWLSWRDLEEHFTKWVCWTAALHLSLCLHLDVCFSKTCARTSSCKLCLVWTVIFMTSFGHDDSRINLIYIYIYVIEREGKKAHEVKLPCPDVMPLWEIQAKICDASRPFHVFMCILVAWGLRPSATLICKTLLCCLLSQGGGGEDWQVARRLKS